MAAGTIDLALLEQDVTFVGAHAGDEVTGRAQRAVAVGDLNGDGQIDLILGASISSGPGARPYGGEVVVVFGPLVPGSVTDLSSVPGAARFYGADDGDQFGFSVAVSDLSGDGQADLVVSAQHADGNQNLRPEAGEVYVFLGPINPGEIWDLSLRAPDVRVVGADQGDGLGWAVTAGDTSGDGYPDLVMTAPFANSPSGGRSNTGAIYTVFGRLVAGLSVDLAVDPINVVVVGRDPADYLGTTVVVTDVSGDGLPDLLMGNIGGDGPRDDLAEAGEAVLLLGPLASGQSIDLKLQPPALTVYGSTAGGGVGAAIAVGDVNGDGIRDLVLGARFSDSAAGGRTASGTIHIVLGPVPTMASIDLGLLPADITIEGRSQYAYHGYSVAVADATGDGIDDVVVGSPGASGQADTRLRAGETYLFHGPFYTGTTMDLSRTSAELTVYGAEAGDGSGTSVMLADLTGDGIADIVLGSPEADGVANSRDECGEAYVVFGQREARCVVLPEPVRGLAAFKSGGDVGLQWSPAVDRFTDRYNVWKVTNGERTRIPVANEAQAAMDPTIVSVCYGVQRSTAECADVGAVGGAAGSLVFYQVRGACRDGAEGIE